MEGLSIMMVTDDNAVSTKNICTHSITSDNNDNIDVNDINNYVKNSVTSTTKNNESNSDENIKEENNGNNVGDSNGGTIAELNNTINNDSPSNITLNKDYIYDASADSGFRRLLMVKVIL